MFNQNPEKNHRNHKIDTSIHMNEMLQFRHGHGVLLLCHTKKMVAHLMSVRVPVIISILLSLFFSLSIQNEICEWIFIPKKYTVLKSHNRMGECKNPQQKVKYMTMSANRNDGDGDNKNNNNNSKRSIYYERMLINSVYIYGCGYFYDLSR